MIIKEAEAKEYNCHYPDAAVSHQWQGRKIAAAIRALVSK